MKCKDCGSPTIGDNLICDSCRQRREEFYGDDDLDDETEFIPCELCDGHPACEDFGCAFELGCGHLVKQDHTIY
jgi:hypothetical protein